MFFFLYSFLSISYERVYSRQFFFQKGNPMYTSGDRVRYVGGDNADWLEGVVEKEVSPGIFGGRFLVRFSDGTVLYCEAPELQKIPFSPR